jgi:hypothetical protein
LVQAFKEGYADTHRQHGDLISLLLFFKNKESRLKMIRELEIKVTLQTQHEGDGPAVAVNRVQDLRQRLPASHAKKVIASTVAGDWHFLFFVFYSSKERKDSLVPRYCCPGTPTSWRAEKGGLLPVGFKH